MSNCEITIDEVNARQVSDQFLMAVQIAVFNACQRCGGRMVKPVVD